MPARAVSGCDQYAVGAVNDLASFGLGAYQDNPGPLRSRSLPGLHIEAAQLPYDGRLLGPVRLANLSGVQPGALKEQQQFVRRGDQNRCGRFVGGQPDLGGGVRGRCLRSCRTGESNN